MALVFVALVFFGAVHLEFRFALLAAVLATAAVLLLAGGGAFRPSGRWALATAALPAWLLIQLVPLPESVRGLVSPGAVSWLRELWPGPLTGCDGTSLVAAQPPAWAPLTLDPTFTWEFLFHVSGALLLFLVARSALAAGGAELRRRVVLAIALFAGAEAVYGLVQWLSALPQILWIEKSAYVDCATGTLADRNHFAMLMYVGLGCTLTLLSRAREAGRQRRDHARDTGLLASLALLAVLQVAAVAASKSRAGLGGAVLVLLPLLVILRDWPRRVRWVAVVIGALIGIPILIYVAPDLVGRLAQLPLEWTGAASRGSVLRSSGALISQFAATGTGGGTWDLVFQRVVGPEVGARYDYAHNDYLQLLVEAGVLGLCAGLWPVLLWVTERRRAGFLRSPDLPLLLALLAVGLHEFFEFSLQITGFALLVALVAAVALPPIKDAAAPVRRLRLVPLALVGALLAGPCLMHSVARWQWTPSSLRWPELPDVRHAAARATAPVPTLLKADARTQCAAIADQAAAQRIRPFYAAYAVTHARRLVAMLQTKAIPAARVSEVSAQASHCAARARGIDPWDVIGVREPMMRVSLQLSEIDRALDDAEVCARWNMGSAQAVVRDLSKIGIPPTVLASRLGQSRFGLQALLRHLLDAGEVESAKPIIPAGVSATADLCWMGSDVLPVLQDGHGVSAEHFLQGCLDIPEVREDPRSLNNVRFWLATDALRFRTTADARRWAEMMSDSVERDSILLDLARRDRDWDKMLHHARAILDNPDRSQDPASDAYLRLDLGRAYAHVGRIADAIEQFERAYALNPALYDLPTTIANLRRGILPE